MSINLDEEEEEAEDIFIIKVFHVTLATFKVEYKICRNDWKVVVDILCYDDSEGIKFVRYGNANGMYDSNHNDGSDSNGFHFVDSPIKF